MKLDATLLVRTPDGPVDPYGTPEFTETEIATRIELQQQGATEELGDAVQVATFRAFLPATTPLRGWDAIRVGGDVYELDGDAALWTSPLSGRASHVEADVRRVE